MKFLLIDNYDSFTYNLYQLFGELGIQQIVRRNDEITIAEAFGMGADGIVISPGPGSPKDAGVSRALIAGCGGRVPILGVCLGMQCVADVFGGRVSRAMKAMHGKTSMVSHDGTGLFAGVPNPCKVARYHSLAASELPEYLKATAHTEDGEIMALRHVSLPIVGVQFHPESFMTEHGAKMMQNFIDWTTEYGKAVPARSA